SGCSVRNLGSSARALCILPVAVEDISLSKLEAPRLARRSNGSSPVTGRLSGQLLKTRRTSILSVLLVLLSSIATPAAVLAQTLRLTVPVGAGSELERYFRAVSLVGGIPASQWTLRPFGPRELDKFQARSPHPWESRAALKS